MLSPVFEQQRAEGEAYTLDIVVVPSAGLSRPSEWIDHSGLSWLQKLIETVVPGATVWEHMYRPERYGPLGQSLLAEGHSLVEALYNHCTSMTGKRPLVLVCHGTGGVCREQPFKYRPVINVVAGAVFLGAPHLVKGRQEAKKTTDLLLKCQHGRIGRGLSSESDFDALVDLCKAFDRIAINVPVISAFESKETSTHHSLFSKLRGRGRNQVIVPESLGVLGAKEETPVDSGADHFGVCKIAIGSKLYGELEMFFKNVMSNAPKKIAEASQPYIIPLGLRDDTLRSASTAGYTKLEENKSHWTPIPVSSPMGGATGGSTIGSFELVPREAAMEITSRDPMLPCFSLGSHRKMDRFLGRQDVMKLIDDVLLPPLATDSGVAEVPTTPESHSSRSATESNELRAFAICGLGGMGKTELAVEYAYSRKERFEAIFWLSADDDKILASNFAQISQRLGLEDDVSDFVASRDVVMGWLSQPLRKVAGPDTPDNTVNWLIIFDNVDNLDVISDYWPKLGRGSVLLTSRDPYAKHSLYVQRGIDLPPLSSSESEALMQRLTHVKADSSQKGALSDIAQKLAGLPLAINQMSGVFRRLRLSYTDFLKYYNEEGIEGLFEKGSSSEPTDPHRIRSLATVWALDRLSKGTRALLQVICLLDPDDIPEDMLIDTSGHVKLERYPRTRGQYYDARSELVGSSLVNRDPEQEKLGLHRLIQETAKAMMSKQELVEAFQAASSLVISAWPFQSLKEHHSVERFSRCEPIFPSVLRLKNGLEPLIHGSAEFPLDIDLARLFNDTGWYMFERGLLEEAKPFCELGLCVGERLDGSPSEAVHESIRQSHSFLGIVLAETNEHSLSMMHKKKWLAMLEERKSEAGAPIEDYELGYAYNEIGVAYGNNAMLDEAAQAFRRSIEIFQGLDDYEDTMLGWPEPNLGFIYWMQGRLEEAEEALVEILDIHAAAWGVDDTKSFKTGKILYGLGNVLESQGRLDESLGFHRRCLEQFKKVLGANHHRVGDIYHRIAGHYMRQGLYKEAETCLNLALKTFSSRTYLLNERARTSFRKGKLLELMGMDAEAKKLLADAYGFWKQLKPSDARPLSELKEADFDDLVAFWSR
ncbi:hypothetical protein B0T19DRAFT_462261 [Cercophora scortea]|uniref:DUF7779 domain-containing protein n=1 Tax=Cercophora scortea TaxID=314031 RepID=A0AAE0IPM0_9PEZI|nr:hypothetical protein B0T19DRAFT_462261 [Cercophora scortea]